MIIKHGDGVYESRLAHCLGDGMAEWCYSADGKPCAFLRHGECCKPEDVPSCAKQNSGRSIVWIRLACDPHKTTFIPHPKEDFRCFCCGNLLPGVGSPNAQTEILREIGCAHFVLQGRDSESKDVEWHICCVCMMALHDMGYPTAKEGMFRLAARRANPKGTETRAWENVLHEAKNNGVAEAMKRRNLLEEEC